MGVVAEAESDVSEQVDPPSAVRERAEAFTAEVLAEAMGHPVQCGVSEFVTERPHFSNQR